LQHTKAPAGLADFQPFSPMPSRAPRWSSAGSGTCRPAAKPNRSCSPIPNLWLGIWHPSSHRRTGPAGNLRYCAGKEAGAPCFRKARAPSTRRRSGQLRESPSGACRHHRANEG